LELAALMAHAYGDGEWRYPQTAPAAFTPHAGARSPRCAQLGRCNGATVDGHVLRCAGRSAPARQPLPAALSALVCAVHCFAVHWCAHALHGLHMRSRVCVMTLHVIQTLSWAHQRHSQTNYETRISDVRACAISQAKPGSTSLLAPESSCNCWSLTGRRTAAGAWRVAFCRACRAQPAACRAASHRPPRAQVCA